MSLRNNLEIFMDVKIKKMFLKYMRNGNCQFLKI